MLDIAQLVARAPRSALPSWLQTLMWLRDPLGHLDRARAKWGDLVSIDVLGWGRLILVGDGAIARQILQTPCPPLSGGEANEILALVVGSQSVFTLEGEEHRRARQLLKPILSPARFGALGPVFLGLIDAWLDALPASLPRFEEELRRITMRLVTHTLFGPRAVRNARALEERIAPLLGTAASVLAFNPRLQRYDGPMSPSRYLRHKVDRFHETLEECWKDSGDEQGPDALQGPLSEDRFLRDQLTSAMIAGYDSTAAAMAWAFYWLSRDTDSRARLRKELEGVRHLGGADRAEAICALPYLDAVCAESIRLTPVVDFYPRTVMPVGPDGRTLVAPCSYFLHTDASTYERPHSFWPERFEKGMPAAPAYAPFGGGTRRCPGAELSKVLAKLVVAQILLRNGADVSSARARPQRRNVVMAPIRLQYKAGEAR